LLAAAEKGYLEIVQLLVRKRANLKIKTKEKGCGALHIAAAHGHLEILNVLADAKQDLDVRNDDGEAPLILATRSSHEPCIRFLLDHRAPIKSTNNLKVSAFLQAARTGSPAIIKILAERGANTEGTARRGLTAVHHAIESKKYELIDPILDTDAALLEIADDLGWTPLHHAAIRNTFATKRLLARGALVDTRSPNGFTPLIRGAPRRASGGNGIAHQGKRITGIR
jgi:ankyrin repeat protein